MNPGDLVVKRGIIPNNPPVEPLVELGKFWKQRLPDISGQIGLLLEREDHWGEDWIRVLFPTGVGWVLRENMKVVE